MKLQKLYGGKCMYWTLFEKRISVLLFLSFRRGKNPDLIHRRKRKRTICDSCKGSDLPGKLSEKSHFVSLIFGLSQIFDDVNPGRKSLNKKRKFPEAQTKKGRNLPHHFLSQDCQSSQPGRLELYGRRSLWFVTGGGLSGRS